MTSLAQLAPLRHRIVVLLGLGNPEKFYSGTRHNAAPLLIHKMVEQLGNFSNDKLGPQHELLLKIKHSPETRKYNQIMSKFFHIPEAPEYGPPKYTVNMNYQVAKTKGVSTIMVTPTISIDANYDKEMIKDGELLHVKNFNRNKITYCLGYVHSTGMNVNGKNIKDFLVNEETFFKKELTKTKCYDDSVGKLEFLNYVAADDTETMIGDIKIKAKTASDKGHNGFRSVTSYMRPYRDIPYSKVFLGISLKKWDEDYFSKILLRDFVLGKFTSKEIETLKSLAVPKLWTEIKKDIMSKEENMSAEKVTTDESKETS